MRALKAKKILLRHWIAVLTVALLAGLLVPFFAGRTRSATAESYAEYDKGQNAVILENENVRRVISFYEGMFVTTEYRDRKAGVTYVSATAPQNEFSMYIDRDGVRQEVRSDSVRFGNWSYVSHENTVLSQGELQISVTLENEILRVTKYYVLYPGTSVIQEWTAVKNISGEALLISMPNIVEKRLSGIDGASSDFMYMTGNANFSGASMLKTIDLSGGYRRLFYSRDNPEVMEVHGWYLDQVATTTMGAGVYNEFFAVHDRSSQNGVFFTFDYIGVWYNDVNFSDGTLSMKSYVSMTDKPLAPDESIVTPMSMMGFWTGDIDDMGNTLGYYQARYKWDYTNDENRVARGIQWLSGRQTDNAFEMWQIVREVGGGSIHIDDSWFDAAGDWNEICDDFKEINDYVKKSGGPGITIWSPVWMTYYQSDIVKAHPDWLVEEGDRGGWEGSNGGYGSHLNFALEEVYQFALAKLGELQERWGSYTWRYDAEAVSITENGYNDMLAQSNNYYRLLREFRTLYPEAGIHGCSSGGESMTIESVRYSDIQQVTDGGVGPVGNYYLSLIFPSYKLEAGSNNLEYTSPWDRSNIPFMHGVGPQNPRNPVSDAGYTAEEMQALREHLEMQKYLAQEGVRDRYSKYFRPLGTGGIGKEYFFQVMNADCTKGAIFISRYDEMVGKTFSIYPKGLVPDQLYTVSSWEGGVVRDTRTGAEWMEEGVCINGLVPGETVFFNLESRPGNDTDHTAPTAPTDLTICEATYLGRTGVEINWNPGTDDTMLAHYNIYRNGELVSTIGYGTFYFGLNGNVYDEWAVASVDGDGNESERIPVTMAGSPDPNAYSYVSDFSTTAGNRGWNYYEMYDDTTLVPYEWNEQGKYYAGGDTLLKKDSLIAGVNPTALEWTAPKAGYVNVYGTMSKYLSSLGGNGVVISIQHNAQTLYRAELSGDNGEGVTCAGATYVDRGDIIRICIDPNGNNSDDKIHLSVCIEYGYTQTSAEEVSFTQDEMWTPVRTETSMAIRLSPANALMSECTFRVLEATADCTVTADGAVYAEQKGNALVGVYLNGELRDTIRVYFYDEAETFDSVRDYSNIQGYRNWSYMYFPNGSPESLSSLTWDASAQIWSGPEAYITVGQTELHPGNAYNAAKVFVAPYTGTMSFRMQVEQKDNSSNGVQLCVYLNGKRLVNYYVDGERTISYPAFRVERGDSLVFAADSIYGNNAYDETGLEVTINYADYTDELSASRVEIGFAEGGRRFSVGESVRLTSSLLPADISSPVLWSIVSGAEHVIFDEETLTITGLTAGTVIVRAMAADAGTVTDTLTLTVTEDPAGGNFNSTSGFSSEQGANGWYYYEYTSGGAYRLLVQYADGTWAGEGFLRVGALRMHPERDRDAVRAYVAEQTGTLRLFGTIRKASGGMGGNGVQAIICLNNRTVYSASLGGSDMNGIYYSVTMQVQKGDVVYLRLNGNGNVDYDETEWLCVGSWEDDRPAADAEVVRFNARVAQLPAADRLTLSDATVVDALVRIYEAFTPEERACVEGYNDLLVCKETLDAMRADLARAQRMDAILLLLADRPTDEFLRFAEGIYGSLSEAQRALVGNADLLEQALAARDAQRALLALAARIEAYTAETVTAADEEAIAALAAEADALGQELPEAARQRLTALEDRLAQLRDGRAAQAVAVLIQSTAEGDEEAIAHLREEMDALTETQRAMLGSAELTRYQALTNAQGEAPSDGIANGGENTGFWVTLGVMAAVVAAALVVSAVILIRKKK